MATQFNHPAEDIEAVRKTSTTIEVTFNVRDPTKTSALEASIKTAKDDATTLSALSGALDAAIGFTITGVEEATSRKSNKV